MPDNVDAQICLFKTLQPLICSIESSDCVVELLNTQINGTCNNNSDTTTATTTTNPILKDDIEWWNIFLSFFSDSIRLSSSSSLIDITMTVQRLRYHHHHHHHHHHHRHRHHHRHTYYYQYWYQNINKFNIL